MKGIKYLIGSLVIVGILFSCQDVIELDLKDVPARLVIEGSISDESGPYTVRLTETVKYYDTNDFPNVDGATVKISDDQGNVEILQSTESGVYQTQDLIGVRGRTYTIEVELDEENYEASSTLPAQYVALDSVTYEYRKKSFFESEGYYFTIYLKDPAKVPNYYRLKVYVNGKSFVFGEEEEESNEDDNLWLWRDKYTDGNVQDIRFPHNLKKGDTLSLELIQLDRTAYDYLRTLDEVISGGGLAPANPLSNFKDKALGYFSAYSIDRDTIVIK